MAYRKMLRRTVTMVNLPFGYALTIRASGAAVVARFGVPSVRPTLFFLIGAILAYAGCAALSSRLLLDPSIAYPIAGFVGTFVYIMAVSGIVYASELLTMRKECQTDR